MGVFAQTFRRPYAPPPESLDGAGNSSNRTFLGTGDPNLIRVSGGPGAEGENQQVAQSPTHTSQSSPGAPVVLPDGSFVPDRFSPTGRLMSPMPDLAPVATAGRNTG